MFSKNESKRTAENGNDTVLGQPHMTNSPIFKVVYVSWAVVRHSKRKLLRVRFVANLTNEPLPPFSCPFPQQYKLNVPRRNTQCRMLSLASMNTVSATWDYLNHLMKWDRFHRLPSFCMPLKL